ncbi:MAG: type II toxin-antitoxin system prevent-host-death family antitoxin [Chloroflexota bacterium]|nr:type II toxin-antitoxin system prevent-host-death family antitoxin [Chloroflexota bacterium]
MKTVGAYEAKTHLSQLLDEVAAGESITITRHGVPVARLVPPTDLRRKNSAKAIEEWIAYRKQHNITLGEGAT